MTKTEIIQQFRDAAADKPFKLFLSSLYNAETLYQGYNPEKPCTFCDAYDTKVFKHYLKAGVGIKACEDELLARTLHDSCISRQMRKFLEAYPEKSQIGIMGGHSLLRTDKCYRDVVFLSKQLTEEGFLMISGGGAGAMEATHLGAWLAGRKDCEVKMALKMLSIAPSYKDERWLDTAFAVRKRFPQKRFSSLGIPTWLYGHEPATPFATHIAKFFDNSIREDTILTVSYGGIVFTPGSAGTVQEIFQEATQSHYLSYGYSSPMIFFSKDFWTEKMPIYTLLSDMMDSGQYQNLQLHVTDDNDVVIDIIKKFSNE